MRYFALVISLCFIHLSAYADDANATYMWQMAKKLNQHFGNLNNMHGSLPPSDASITDELGFVAIGRSSEVSTIKDLLYLRSRMVDKSDWAEVNGILTNWRTLFVDFCPESIKHINAQIGLAKSPAVVSEGEHLRDDLVEVCDRLKRLK